MSFGNNSVKICARSKYSLNIVGTYFGINEKRGPDRYYTGSKYKSVGDLISTVYLYPPCSSLYQDSLLPHNFGSGFMITF